jgi:hypothetical protein
VTPEEVVERAYEVFARYDLPPVMDYCTACWSLEDEKRWHAPLRAMPRETFGQYVWDAIHHVGDATDFKHFAPRVLEDVLLGVANEPGLYLHRFGLAGFTDWPEPERRAVLDVVDVIWERHLAGYDAARPYPTDDVLGAVGDVLGDLAGVLAAWGARTDRAAVANLAELVVRNPDSVLHGATLGGWWWDDLQQEQVVAWLREPARRDQVIGAFTGEGDAIDDLLARAGQVLAGAAATA